MIAPYVQTLKLNTNQLTNFFIGLESVINCSCLQYLELKYNELDIYPRVDNEYIRNNMRRMYLQYNKIKCVTQAELAAYTLMWTVHLSSNGLENIVDDCTTMHVDRTINFGPRYFYQLYLSNNHLKTIPNLSAFQYIQTLSFENNDITFVRYIDLIQHPKLKQLNLINNPLLTIEDPTQLQFEYIPTFHLDNTAVVCDVLFCWRKDPRLIQVSSFGIQFDLKMFISTSHYNAP